jgi:hypothetical protein
MVDWRRYEDLSISNLFIGGALPTALQGNAKLFWYEPHFDSNGDGNTVSRSELRLEGLLTYFNNCDSSSWDPVHVSERGRIESTGNFCKDTLSNFGNHECKGLLGGMKWNDVQTYSSLSAIATGNSNFADGHSAYCSDCKPNTSPCQGSGSGTIAVRIGNQWDCDAVQTATTASSLATDPTDCSSGSYATAIAANGNLTCSVISGSQISGAVGTATALATNPTDCSSGYATAIDAGGNLTCSTLAAKERTRTTDYQKIAADLNAAAATAEAPVAKIPGYASTVVAAHFTPSAALTCSDTNYATITVSKRSAGGAATQLFQKQTKCTGGTGSWTQYAPVSLGSVAGGGADAMGADGVFTWQISKSGSGVVVPAGVLTIEYTVNTP